VKLVGVAQPGRARLIGVSALALGAVLEPRAVVAGLGYLAMMREAVEQRRCHLGVAKGKVGGHDHRCLLIEPADEMEQQLAAGLGHGQIAEFIEDYEVEAAKPAIQSHLAPSQPFGFEMFDQIDDIEEAAACTVADAGTGDGDGEMGLAGFGAANEDGVTLMSQEVAAGKVTHQGLVDRRAVEGEVLDLIGQWQFGDRHLVFASKAGFTSPFQNPNFQNIRYSKI
jgi:hypothetical protein